jgi:FtsZ-interacting cell division protein YlmF
VSRSFYIDLRYSKAIAEAQGGGAKYCISTVRWRAKFDLNRYVPSLFDKARLIAEAEATERSEAVLVKPTKAQETKEKKTSKSRAQKKVRQWNNIAPNMVTTKPMQRQIVTPLKTGMAMGITKPNPTMIVLFSPRNFARKSTS